MQITIKIRRSGQPLGEALAKQSRFATALAMNRTIEEGQKIMQARIQSRFRIRNSFVTRLVKIRPEDRARADRLTARIRIEGPEGELGKGAILARHEDGGTRDTGRGGYSVDPSYRVQGMFFLPTSLLRGSPSTVIPRGSYPANLRLAPRRDVDGGTMGAKVHTTGTGKLQLKGKRRTFVLFGANGGGPIGIYQRGSGAKGKTQSWDIHKIWSFRPKVTLRRRLGFFAQLRATTDARYVLNYRGFLQHALRTAK